MTERLYYENSYTQKFKANIVERIKQNDRLAVVLDQTYFYPTSGGQPADRGRLGETSVVDVFIRPTDGAIVHRLAGEVWADEVTCTIDWNRRFDHMQQHTGQHILSQAFQQIAQANTVSFHLGEESVTIDLHRRDLTAQQVEDAELLANQIIWGNRPVRAYMVSPEQAQELQLRKLPPAFNGQLRIVNIEKFDLNACGGTHVANTGEVGQIKIVKLERRGNELRVEFRCGQRALTDYRIKNSIINRLSNQLTTGYWELEDGLARLLNDAKESKRTLKKWQTALLEREVARQLEKAEIRKGLRIVTSVYDPAEEIDVRQLAGMLGRQQDVIALLGLTGEQTQLVFVRSEDAPGQMNLLIKPALQILGSASGGGTAQFAQGGGPAGDRARVQQALVRAEKLLLAQLR